MFDVVVGMLSYIVGTIFRARKAVVVFDVVVGILLYIMGANFRTLKVVRCA